ncbi:MAG: MIP/aquaporin family protein [Pseudomonadota bacterium]
MLTRKLLAEGVGTALLLMTIIGSGIMGDNLANQQPGDTLTPQSIVTGAMLFVLIALMGPISGAHFNPAVTMVFTLRRDLPPGEAVSFVAVQIIGGISGVWLAHMMFGVDVAQFSLTERTGTNLWFAEILATAGLILVILGGLRTNPALIPALVGLYIMSAYWFTASTSFANPAVTIARTLSDSFSGIYPAHAPAYIAAQIVGALSGWALASVLWPKED